MKLISDQIGADWDAVIEGFVRDGRVGHSHVQVLVLMAKWDLEEVVFRKMFKH